MSFRPIDLGKLLLLILVLDACTSGKYPTRPSLESVDEAPSLAAPRPPAASLRPEFVLDAPSGVGGQQTPIGTFTISPTQLPAPSDVLREVAFGQGGASPSAEGWCGQAYAKPEEDFSSRWQETLDHELLRHPLSSLTCGWRLGEVVRVTVDFPDGRSVSESLRARLIGDGFGVHVMYIPQLTDPEGTYTITFQGEQERVSAQRHVVEPTGPRVLWYSDVQEETDEPKELWLYGFAPHESVQLYAYHFPPGEEWAASHLLGVQEFQVNGQGWLTVRPELSESFYLAGFAAVGEVSGEAASFRPDCGVFVSTFGQSILNPAYVIANRGGEPLEVKEEYYGDIYDVVRRVNIGTRLQVLDSFCEYLSGRLSWRVRLDDGQTGYVAGERVTPVLHFNAQSQEMEIPVQAFRIAASDQMASQDVVQEAAFFDAQGWIRPTCSTDVLVPSLIWPLSEQHDVSLELGWGRLTALTCGWQPHGLVFVTLDYPGNKSTDVRSVEAITGTKTTGDGCAVGVTYDTTLDDPPGQYVMTFGEFDETIRYTRQIVPPSGPRLLWDWDEKAKTDSQLFLYNFTPYEHVRLVAYGRTGEDDSRGILVSLQEFQVDSSGRLILRPDPDGASDIGGYAAIGYISGEALGRKFWPPVDDYIPIFVDDASILSRLVVPNTGGKGIVIRSGPGPEYPILVESELSTKLRVTSQPIMDTRGISWVQVLLDDGTQGWVASDSVASTTDYPMGVGQEELQMPEEVFEISPSQRMAPQDVLEEIALFAGGGGPILICSESDREPTVVYPVDIAMPVERAAGVIHAFACGWQPNESVQATMEYPDGEVFQRDLPARLIGDGYGALFTYTMSLDDPAGLYRVTFQGEEGSATSSHPVVEPKGPRLLWYWRPNGEWRDTGELILYNFEPEDRIRLFVYDGFYADSRKGRLLGWRELTADAAGQLMVQSEWGEQFDVGGYAAVGERSGEAASLMYYRDMFWPVFKESVQRVAQVVANADTGLHRAEEGYQRSSEPVQWVSAGTRMDALASWRDDSKLWWRVRLSDGTEGWVLDEEVTRVTE